MSSVPAAWAEMGGASNPEGRKGPEAWEPLRPQSLGDSRTVCVRPSPCRRPGVRVARRSVQKFTRGHLGCLITRNRCGQVTPEGPARPDGLIIGMLIGIKSNNPSAKNYPLRVPSPPSAPGSESLPPPGLGPISPFLSCQVTSLVTSSLTWLHPRYPRRPRPV